MASFIFFIINEPSFFKVTIILLSQRTGELISTFSKIPNLTSLYFGSTNSSSGLSVNIICKGCILQLLNPDFMYMVTMNFLNILLDKLSNPGTSLWVKGSGASDLVKHPHVNIPFFNGKVPLHTCSESLTGFKSPGLTWL